MAHEAIPRAVRRQVRDRARFELVLPLALGASGFAVTDSAASR